MSAIIEKLNFLICQSLPQLALHRVPSLEILCPAKLKPQKFEASRLRLSLVELTVTRVFSPDTSSPYFPSRFPSTRKTAQHHPLTRRHSQNRSTTTGVVLQGLGTRKDAGMEGATLQSYRHSNSAQCPQFFRIVSHATGCAFSKHGGGPLRFS